MMKKHAVLLLAAAMLLGLCACGSPAPEETKPSGAQIANPFVGYPSLAEACEAAGFTMTAPDSIEGYGEKLVSVMSGEMIQVMFKNESGGRVTLRKEKGDGDISGDWNVYSDTKRVTVGDTETTVKGNDGLYSVVVWTKNGYAFSVTADDAMTLDALTAIAAQVG